MTKDEKADLLEDLIEQCDQAKQAFIEADDILRDKTAKYRQEGGFRNHMEELTFARHVDSLQEEFDELRERIEWVKEQPEIDPHEDADGCWEHGTTLDGIADRLERYEPRRDGYDSAGFKYRGLGRQGM